MKYYLFNYDFDKLNMKNDLISETKDYQLY